MNPYDLPLPKPPLGPLVRLPAFTGLYTKDQVLTLLKAWQQPPVMPTAKQSVITLRFPPGSQFPRATIEASPQKSTYGKRLWAVKLWAQP